MLVTYCKYALSVILLAGCVGNPKPYTCFNIDHVDDINSVVGVGDVFCVADTDFQYMNKRKYDTNNIQELLNYSTSTTDIKCHFYDQDQSSDYFTLLNGKKVKKATRVYVCPSGTVNAFERDINEKIKRAEEQKLQEKIKKLEKKIGKKFCSYDDLPHLSFYSTDGIPNLNYMGQSALKNCAFQLGWQFTVLSQTESGTLITVNPAYSYTMGDGVYFIIKNNRDSELVDNQDVEDGYFENIGKFQYTSVSGAKKTVLKLKRLSGSSDLMDNE